MANIFVFAILLLGFFQFLSFNSLNSVELIQTEAKIAKKNSNYMKLKSMNHTNIDLQALKLGVNE